MARRPITPNRLAATARGRIAGVAFDHGILHLDGAAQSAIKAAMKTLSNGPIVLPNSVPRAPMWGVTDGRFRRLAALQSKSKLKSRRLS